MQNLPSSSSPFKAGNGRRRERLSGYVMLGLVMKEVRRYQPRLLVPKIPLSKVIDYLGWRR